MSRDVKAEMINAVQLALDITPAAAKVLVDSLPFREYVELFRCVRYEKSKIPELFGVMVEEPTLNNVKPLANVTPVQPVQPVQPGQPSDPVDPVSFKPGENLKIGTQDGELDANFNKMLPNGDIEVKIGNQIQRIGANDQNFTINREVDENTSSGCIASSPTPMGSAQKPPHVYRRKSK